MSPQLLDLPIALLASGSSSRTTSAVVDTLIPAWKRKLKSTTAPPNKPDFDLPTDIKSTSSISLSSTTSKTPSIVSLKIVDQELDYYGNMVDIPIEKLQSGNSTNIFGEDDTNDQDDYGSSPLVVISRHNSANDFSSQ